MKSVELIVSSSPLMKDPGNENDDNDLCWIILFDWNSPEITSNKILSKSEIKAVVKVAVSACLTKNLLPLLMNYKHSLICLEPDS